MLVDFAEVIHISWPPCNLVLRRTHGLCTYLQQKAHSPRACLLVHFDSIQDHYLRGISPEPSISMSNFEVIKLNGISAKDNIIAYDFYFFSSRIILIF